MTRRRDDAGGDASGRDDPGRTDLGRADLGPAGVPFPSEAEWLDLPLPPADELPLRGDFVARTLRALDADGAPEPMLTADRLAAYRTPEPSSAFVDGTLAALRADRKQRWRELLARHIAPEPAPGFVARTLAALSADRLAADGDEGAGDERARADGSHTGAPPARRGRAALRLLGPLLAVAAIAALWLLLRGSGADDRAPLEVRFARSEPAAFAAAWTASPMAAVLAADARADDPWALAAGGPDPVWLALGGER